MTKQAYLEQWLDTLTRDDVQLWVGYEKDGPLLYVTIAGYMTAAWLL